MNILLFEIRPGTHPKHKQLYRNDLFINKSQFSLRSVE